MTIVRWRRKENLASIIVESPIFVQTATQCADRVRSEQTPDTLISHSVALNMPAEHKLGQAPSAPPTEQAIHYK